MDGTRRCDSVSMCEREKAAFRTWGAGGSRAALGGRKAKGLGRQSPHQNGQFKGEELVLPYRVGGGEGPSRERGEDRAEPVSERAGGGLLSAELAASTRSSFTRVPLLGRGPRLVS